VIASLFSKSGIGEKPHLTDVSAGNPAQDQQTNNEAFQMSPVFIGLR
jgi:hypothetical protein